MGIFYRTPRIATNFGKRYDQVQIYFKNHGRKVWPGTPTKIGDGYTHRLQQTKRRIKKFQIYKFFKIFFKSPYFLNVRQAKLIQSRPISSCRSKYLI